MYNYCYMRTPIEFSVVVYLVDVEAKLIDLNTKSPVLGYLLLLVLADRIRQETISPVIHFDSSGFNFVLTIPIDFVLDSSDSNRFYLFPKV